MLVQRLADENEELPVKVEAAIAIQYLLHGQEKGLLFKSLQFLLIFCSIYVWLLFDTKSINFLVRMLLLPHVRVVILEVLKLVAKAEIEAMTSVMDEIMEEFVEHVIPVAVEVTTELVNN